MKLRFQLLTFFLFTLLFSFFFAKSANSALAAAYTLSGSVKNNSGTAIVGATVSVNDTSSDSTTTDGSGNYTLSIPEGTYNIQVTPPSGSGFSSAIAYSQSVSANTILNFILTPTGTVVLSGHVYGPLGNPLPNQTVYLFSSATNQTIITTTGTDGSYSLQTSPGTFTLDVNSTAGNDSSLNAPQDYDIHVNSYLLTQSTILNITIPAKKIDIQVQDGTGLAVASAGIQVKNSNGGTRSAVNNSLAIGGNVTSGIGTSNYGWGGTIPTTDNSGKISLWLLPTTVATYTILVTPPNGSSYTVTSSTASITSDTQKTITLLQPVTLSGHVYGPLGNALPNQTVYLFSSVTNQTIPTTTDVNGAYSLQVAPGTFTLDINSNGGTGNDPSLNAPQSYEITVNNYSLTQNTTLDITIPAKKIDIHIQDAGNTPLENAGVQVRNSNGGTSSPVTNTLSIGGGITNAIGRDNYGWSFSIPKTDHDGNVSLWLLPTSGSSTYSILANPPSGTTYTATNLTTAISDTTQKTITMLQPVILSGHVYGPLRNALPNQNVYLFSSVTNQTTTAITDANGNYSLQVASGTYTLDVNSNTNTENDPSLNAPQHYDIHVNNYLLTQNTVLDLTIPAKKVVVHVQDVSNSGLANVGIQVRNSNGGTQSPINNTLAVGQGITNGIGASSYGWVSIIPKTDAGGDISLWLLPTTVGTYTFLATPQNGSVYTQFALTNISVTGDQTELISLQYNHSTPVTSSSLSPSADSQGNYQNPTTVTLSATAASGYTIANTYYTIDGGSQQTYTIPFTVAGNGNHTITYWSVDSVGVPESHNSKTFTILTTYSLSGTVYNDLNQNGFQDSGETGYSGATVSLNTGQIVTTDSSGNYSLPNLQAGTYTETLTLPNEYSATTTNPATISLSADTTQNFGIAQSNSLVLGINAGGDTQGNFVADTDFSGGTEYSSSNNVDISGVTNPAPEAVYQTVRYGNFSYTIPNLTPNSSYTVKLHFNELYWGTSLSGNNGGIGSRVFDVSLNGQQVLTNYDIYQKAGGANKAIVEQLPTTTDANGNIAIQFTTVTDNAMVNGIELYNGTLPSPSPTPTPTPDSSVIINAGGSTAGNFVSDKDYNGGQIYTSTAAVDTSTVTNPAPQSVYQSVRYGNFTYTIPNLTPNTNFLVRLHFNELYWNTAGSRAFNVSINGSQVLNNFDIFQVAGGANKAIVEDFVKPSDATGKITIQFTSITDNAMVNGIEIVPPTIQ